MLKILEFIIFGYLYVLFGLLAAPFVIIVMKWAFLSTFGFLP